MRWGWVTWVAVAALWASPGFTADSEASRPNILFIAVDDLNHWVGHLGRNKQVKTPNIDKLAARGVTFTRAYCAAPVCNPSRAALMSGLRPSSSAVYDNGTDWRKLIPETLPLTAHFRKHGYVVKGAGKIYHGAFDRRSEWDDYFKGAGGEPRPTGTNGGVGGIRFAPLDCEDADMPDYRIASWGIDQLGETNNKPFFLAIGFHKPHMPWNVPRKYYERYPLEKIELPPHQTNDLDDLPPAGVKMAGAAGDHAAILKSGRWKEAVQAYLAAISFLDAQVGRLMEGFEKSPSKTNTIICFWGDHGWHLGEKEHWRKFALWEEATRAPFIWVVPGVTKPGGACDRTVDFMSIYPTLSELCGLPIPSHVEGSSIKTLLRNPAAPWNTPALTTHGFRNHAVRTENWRYIRYENGDEELYDERVDPFEWQNLARDPKRGKTKEEMALFLPKNDKPTPPDARRSNQRRQNRNRDDSAAD